MTYVIGARVPRGLGDRCALLGHARSISLRAAAADARPAMAMPTTRFADRRRRGSQDRARPTTPISGTPGWKRGPAQRFPMIEEIEFTWGGQVMETIDGLAFIGRNPAGRGECVCRDGRFRHGHDARHDRRHAAHRFDPGPQNPWATLYDPVAQTAARRGRVRQGEPQHGGAVRRLADRPAKWSRSTKSRPAAAPCCGAGSTKVAVYRDEKGDVHEMSAVCPHLGCIVHWNAAEKTWDCPCHGSRFDKLGKVINGPANVDLSPFKET